MRIVLLNWAGVWQGPEVGGGLAGYVQGLAVELVSAGHEVWHLSSGRSFVPRPDADEPAPCQIRRHPDWLGVRCVEVINSPVLAPAIRQFQSPAPEAEAPELQRVVGEFLTRLAPDVVHVHSLEGFSAGCVKVARSAGARVVFTLHNYHTICPQVYLLRGHRLACRDCEGGRACERCIEAPDPAAELRTSIGAYRAEHAPPPAPPPRLPPPLPIRIRSRVVDELRLMGPPPPPPPPPRMPMPGIAWHVHPVDRALPPEGDDERGRAELVASGFGRGFTPTPEAADWQPIDNDPPAHAAEPASNAYARRRTAMIDALNACDRVLAVSDFVAELFARAGVQRELLTTLRIGTRAAELAEHHRELLFDPPPNDPARARPVRLVFIGQNHWCKGLPVLADALELLVPEVLARLDVSIFAHEGGSIEWRFRRLEPRLARLTFHHGYQFTDLPWIMGGKDLGVVPSSWWDNAPQTVLEMQACGVPVLGARLGGIPEQIRDGVDGLLFTGNDRYDLARMLARVVGDPGVLTRLRSAVRPPMRMPDHARALVDEYQRLVPAPTNRDVSCRP